MVKRFNPLKVFKHGSCGSMTALTQSFPMNLIGTFTNCYVVTENNLWDRLYPDHTNVFNYTINLGVAIRDSDFRNLSCIVLPHLESCLSIQPSGVHRVVFEETARTEFINTCNTFLGKAWDAILPEFCDALALLADTATVNNKKLYEVN